MVMYDNEFKTKENKIWTKDKIDPQHTRIQGFKNHARVRNMSRALTLRNCNFYSVTENKKIICTYVQSYLKITAMQSDFN